ncbi:ATP-binding protein [Streptomyces sp. NBC_01361]|uniref:ATP-binding protein n=1 Tax=Streptomyces sp. NBC_01361 TaxID=2903838 RepID=UPI002E37BB59|nr:ATP-binding protein [Streptomyces sp. NBC_01361]
MRHLAQHASSASPQTGRAARDFAMQTLDSWGRCQRGGDIRACVSELAGHAVQHGSPDGCTYLVRLIRHSHCLHVAVHDSARYFRVRIPPAALSGEAGRGIRTVQERCNDWGVRDLTGEGKAVRTCFRRPEAHVSRCAVTP